MTCRARARARARVRISTGVGPLPVVQESVRTNSPVGHFTSSPSWTLSLDCGLQRIRPAGVCGLCLAQGRGLRAARLPVPDYLAALPYKAFPLRTKPVWSLACRHADSRTQ